MYLIAPMTAHEHMASMVLVYSVVGWLWLSGRLVVTPALAALATTSLLLIGVYAPMSLVAAVLPLGEIMEALGNPDAPFGEAIGQYDFLGFPGLGLVLAWFVLVVIERQLRQGKPAGAAQPDVHHASPSL
jgi:hypothetical protein